MTRRMLATVRCRRSAEISAHYPVEPVENHQTVLRRLSTLLTANPNLSQTVLWGCCRAHLRADPSW